MAEAVTVRRDGDVFQARCFWLKAARLLDPGSPVSRVGFETGPKAFDDIWVEYDNHGAPNDQDGRPLLREHIQCKWHVTPNIFGYSHLVDPEFINANAFSLLHRARAAQLAHAPFGEGARFRLLTNWQIDRADALNAIVSSRSHALKLDHLFGPGTDRSAMGRVRKLWREHLDIDDAQLKVLARTLAVSSSAESLEDLRDRLDMLFANVGLRRVPVSESASIYDELIFQWLGQGRVLFDRDTFRAACERERLLDRGQPSPRVFGVKSFEHPIDKLEERCTAVLNLVPQFDQRFIRSEADWSSTLYPALRQFLLTAAKDNERLRLVLDAHLSLSFAAGSVLNIKSGREIELEQRTIGTSIWSPMDAEHDAQWPGLVWDTVAVNEKGQELAVAVGLTHDVTAKVRAYIDAALPQIKTLLLCQPSSGPSARSVACGRHAFELAEALTAHVMKSRSLDGEQGAAHLFIASPGAFAFFLGQRQPGLGRIVLYEFDFEGTRGGSYLPSLSLPIA
jgi:hypothetical protein